jgi:hypothetical protein
MEDTPHSLYRSNDQAPAFSESRVGNDYDGGDV